MRTGLKATIVSTLAGAPWLVSLAIPAVASADQIGYIINVTLRPTYNFANAQAALDYGYGCADRINAKTSYTDTAADQGRLQHQRRAHGLAYLLSQAAQELAAQTWQLRRSAAGYRPA